MNKMIMQTPHFLPLMTRALIPNDDNTRRSRDDLSPSYGNSLVERYFWKKEKPYKNLKGVYSTLSLHKTTSLRTQLGFQILYKESFYSNMQQRQSHIAWTCLYPFSLNSIKRPHDPFPKDTQILLQKSYSREAFYFEKHHKLKFLGWDLFQSKAFQLNLLNLWVFCFVD